MKSDFLSIVKLMIAKNNMEFTPLLKKFAKFPNPRNQHERDANYQHLVELCEGDEQLVMFLMN